MQNMYTEDDLLHYIYGECSDQDAKLIAAAIIQNQDLRQQYLELMEGVNVMNQDYQRPSESAIYNILQFAKEANKQQV